MMRRVRFSAVRFTWLAAVCAWALTAMGCTNEDRTASPRIDVEPVLGASATVPAGLTLQLVARAIVLADGTEQPVVGAVAWTSSDDTIAEVSDGGLVSSHRVGVVAIEARQPAATGRLQVDVTDPVPVELAVQPDAARVVRGLHVQFQARVTLSDGTTGPAEQVSWQSLAEGTAGVDANGLATGITAGIATIRASSLGVSGDASLEVMGQRVAFVTSESGTADLRTWTSTGGQGGLQGADRSCATLAAAAGLPGTFRAWLSDTSDDAYCRVHGLAGKRSASCGQAVLPADAGPWVRTDGEVFAGGIEDVTAGAVYLPIRHDEHGEQKMEGFYYTATTELGELSTIRTTCADWTGTVDYTDIAYVDDASFGWTAGAATMCSNPGSLLCLEVGTGPGVALPPFTTEGKAVFRTSTRGTADLGSWAEADGMTGVAAGDAICQTLASRGGLPNASRFKAWLGTGTIGAAGRVTSDGPWVRLDGVLVAASRAELLSAEHWTSISTTETGDYAPALWYAWTGVESGGAATGSACNDWTDGSGSSEGPVGLPHSAGSMWSGVFEVPCSQMNALYCFED